MKNWILVICTLFFFGILLFVFESDEQDLGDNYFYLPAYEAIDIGHSEGAIIYKSITKNVFSDVKIHGNIISVNSNRDFVIAIQQFKDISNSNKNKQLNYFIIAKKADIVYGPFKKEEYLQKREEVGVPEELNLNE